MWVRFLLAALLFGRFPGFILESLSAILYGVDEGRIEELLKKNLAVAEDTHRMIRAMRRNAFWGGVFKTLWWAVLIIVPIIAYYLYLAPLVEQAAATYGKVEQGVNQVQGLTQNLQSLPEPLRGIVQSFLQGQGQ